MSRPGWCRWTGADASFACRQPGYQEQVSEKPVPSGCKTTAFHSSKGISVLNQLSRRKHPSCTDLVKLLVFKSPQIWFCVFSLHGVSHPLSPSSHIHSLQPHEKQLPIPCTAQRVSGVQGTGPVSMLAQILCVLEAPAQLSQTRLMAGTRPQPPRPGRTVQHETFCVSALGRDGRIFYSEEAPDNIIPRSTAQS